MARPEVGSPPTFFFEERGRAPTGDREGNVDAEALVRPVIEGEGLDLVDVTFGREGGRRILRVTVDRDGGIDLDTISRVSDKVSRRLDLEGFEPGPYALELTTPGIERPLRRPEDFRRAVGERARVTTDEGVAEGELLDAGDDEIRIATDGERLVPLARVTAARTVVDWAAELKGSGR
jgi:ribosome maturation factor RimP